MFPRCTILYKTENTDGWYYAVMSGDKVACKKQCAKLIKENKWIDYKFYECYHCTIKRDIPFQNVVPDPHSIHLCTNLIFHPNNEKMYYPDEIMPYPKQKRKIVDNFNLIVESEEELENYRVPDCKDRFECGQLLKICFEKKRNYIIAIVEDVYNDIPFFLERLKKEGYSNLSIEEYTFSKFLAWNCGENIRFIVQLYFHSELKVAYDKLIPKKMFYSEFERIYPILKLYIEKKNSLYDEFKLEQNLIKSLKWKYDKDSIDYPKEYVSILNSKKNKEKLYKLIDKIERSKKKHILNLENPRTYITAYFAENYFYWLENNKIYRVRQYGNEKIKRFISSSDFVYKEGMTLTSVYKQMLEKGYDWAMECKYLGKTFEVYTNCSVESSDATTEEKITLEQILKNLVFSKDGKCSIREIYLLFENYNIDVSSFREVYFKLV